MFGLGITSKGNFLTYSTLFVFLMIRIVPRSVVMVTTDMCGKTPMTGDWIYGITWKHMHFNISVHFIVDTTSILKLMFPIYLLFVSWQSLQWLCCWNDCCCCFFFSVLAIAIFIFVMIFIFTTVPFVVNVIITFFAVIVAVNVMLMFSNLVVLRVSYFTINSVDK